jgi:hypothetical protein
LFSLHDVRRNLKKNIRKITNRRDTQPKETHQTQTTEEERVEPNQETDLLVPARTARAVVTRSGRVMKPIDILDL